MDADMEEQDMESDNSDEEVVTKKKSDKDDKLFKKDKSMAALDPFFVEDTGDAEVVE